ncbi:DMT family transporter [Aquabacter sp. L1I39]|uniref:DMT family transporter n=1 Tax=Aquabacter sp. L1I39 TaxID=2820278 RepID=UPI001ADBC642|nr:DMT family transporter [Aquabacter sp. L1I39]QTL03308.1 DMT family transporter [Aquabacter sp. L1I39]
MTFLYPALAFAIGACIAIQAPVNNQLALSLGGGPLMAALVSFLVGSAFLLAIALFGGGLPAAVAALPRQPLWKLSGGLLGAAYLLGSVFLVPRIGLAGLLALVIAGQIACSLTIDHFGLLGLLERKITLARAIGAGLVMGGVLVMLYGDRLISTLRG